MTKEYVVLNRGGVKIRKVMHTYNNISVGKYDKSDEVIVYSTHDVRLLGHIYTWGRVSEKPDEHGQHRYVALKRTGGKVFCEFVKDIPDSIDNALVLGSESKQVALDLLDKLRMVIQNS